MESIVVNKDFIKQKSNYNIQCGGRTGPKDPKKTEYYKSGEHTRNALAARELACKKQAHLKQQRVKNYYSNPILCKHCNTPLEYNKKRNKFCSKSCAASFNNTGRKANEEQKKKVSKTMKLIRNKE